MDSHARKSEKQARMNENQRKEKDSLERDEDQERKNERQSEKNGNLSRQSESFVQPNASSSSELKASTVDAWLLGKPKSNCEFVDEIVVQSPVDRNAEEYCMNHKRRGVALIFNHIYFKKMAPRNGSKKDCEDIKQTLKKFDFDVRDYTDLTAEATAKILKLTAAEDHTDADCLVVVAMSHGESGFLFSADNMYPVDMLWAPFTGDECTTLVGKPKLFFIQACRGVRLDKPVKIIHETDSRDSYSIPAYADIMVAYSTYDGFYSWRNPDAGSWFIQALCEELNLNGQIRDLLTIMTFVNRRVAIEYKSYVPYNERFHDKKQIPSIVSMLTRLVYFREKSL